MAEPSDSLLRRGRRSLLLLIGCWTLPAVMIGIGVVAIQRGSGQGDAAATVLARQLWYYWFFAALCPLLYRMQGRVPFTRGSWLRPLLVHAAAGVAVVLAAMVLSGLVDWAIAHDAGVGPADRVGREFTSPHGQLQAIVHAFYFVVAVGAMMMVRLVRQRQQDEERAAELALRTSRLEAQVSQARLKALERQLNPHFLFNALNSIASLVQQKKTDPAYEAIALLGDLLRETLQAGDRHTIPLEREVKLLERYLDLERLRFSDRLQASVEVAADCREAAVPAMVLQPLVENAIRHGISEMPGAGRLRVAVRKENAHVAIEVRDDGPGLPAGWALETGAGVGLTNLRDRLRAHFEDGFELTLEPGRPRGTVARVSFPFRPFPASGS